MIDYTKLSEEEINARLESLDEIEELNDGTLPVALDPTRTELLNELYRRHISSGN